MQNKKSKNPLPKIYVIVGATASGKTDASIKLAKKINGEIVSADSRQVYKYLDIGSGKVTEKEMNGVRHYCLDIAEPKSRPAPSLPKEGRNATNFSVQDYLKHANKAIKEILEKGKTPIICGGTGFYIDAILYGLPKNALPNPLLRERLEKETLENLLEKIKNLNLEKYNELTQNKNPSERNNKRRLIRIIEILTPSAGLPAASPRKQIQKLNTKLKYDVEFVFIERSKEELRERINLRLKKRLEAKGRNNLINEVKDLIENKNVDPDWLISLGLEYKYVTLFLQNKISYEKMTEEIENKSWQYAKRQMLWNRRYKSLNLENPEKKTEISSENNSRQK